MAPAAASILPATSGAAAASKRPAASDATDHLMLLVDHSSALPQPQQGDEAAQQKSQHQPRQQLECPRCRSTNTKFCYYNNYSTAQPRHFCRACRRYWTHGGTLRDVPVGGGGSKRRRVSSSAEPPQPLQTLLLEDACCPPDHLSPAAFPFLSDGSYLPQQFDLGLFAPPAAFASPSSGVPDFYDGLAPWDDGTGGGVAAGAWGDIAGLDLSWPPPGN